MVSKDLAVRLDFAPDKNETVAIIIHCAATCTGTVDKAVLMGEKFKTSDDDTYRKLADALRELADRMDEIKEEARKP